MQRDIPFVQQQLLTADGQKVKERRPAPRPALEASKGPGPTPPPIAPPPPPPTTTTTTTTRPFRGPRHTAWLAEAGIGALAYSGKLMAPSPLEACRGAPAPAS